MNQTSNQVPWNKLLAIVLFVGLIGYVLARPALERWWGIALPSLTEDLKTSQAGPPAAEGTSRSSSEAPPSSKQTGRDRPQDPAPANKPNPPGKADPFEIAPPKKTTNPPKPAPREKGPAKFELKKLEAGRLQSPAGLIYSPGPQGEHRLEHVMQHAKDEPGRSRHGVFVGSQEDILQLIDEAYLLVRRNSRQVSRQADGDRMAYTIRLERAIGYEGGRSGKRNNYPRLSRLRLVLEDGNQVVTAYPVE